jgi:hypothetical protein
VDSSSKQLLAFRFGSDSRFEGQLVGALERAESGGAIRVLDALFIARDQETGELTAFSMGGKRSGSITAQMLDFRLDDRARAASTKRALEEEGGEAVKELADSLGPGEAVAAVIVEHVWSGTLTEAVARVGGTGVVSELVEVTRVTEVAHRLSG